MSELPNILAHAPALLLVIFRIGGLTIFGPVLGSPAIPVKVKVLFAFATGIAIYPVLPASAVAGAPELHLWALVPMVALELLFGLVVGWLASLPLVAMQTGGLIIGQQMGLGFARFYNPDLDDEGDVIGQMLFFMALAGFLVVGGHEAMLLCVMRSFEHVPLGGLAIGAPLLDMANGLLLASFELALRVAAPVLAVIFLESVAMGFMAKTVPQLNILSLGFPLRILGGLALVMVGLVVINDVMMESIDWTLQAIFTWVEGS